MAPFGGENAESYYDEGLTAGVKGDLARAVACLEKAIELDPSFLAAHQQLAKCCMRLGHIDRAVAILRHVLSKRSGLVAAKLDLGFALIEKGELKEAREQFVEVMQTQAGNARAGLGLANICFAEGNWEAAVALAQESRARGGASFPVLYLLGRAAKLAGNQALSEEAFEGADALLKRSLDLNGEQVEARYLRGELAFHQNKFPAALEQYRAAAEHGEEGRTYTVFGQSFSRVDALAKQGLCLQRIGETELARKMGERIVAVDPEHKIGQSLKNL